MFCITYSTNTISSNILATFNFLARVSIFASIYLITMLKYFLCLKKSMTCLNISTIGIYTMDELIYTYIEFKSIDIPRGMPPLSSITDIMESNIIVH